MCADTYFVNSANTCSSCKLNNCLECDSNYNCSLCEAKYIVRSTQIGPSSFQKQCLDCNKYMTGYSQYYTDCAYCTAVAVGPNIQATCSACMNGFWYGNKCVSVCPAGYYGDFTFNVRGMLTQSVCRQCHASCKMCIDQMSNTCSRCGKNQYLKLLDYTKSYGTCVTKTATNSEFKLYVTPELTAANPNLQLIDGTILPFNYLDDAMRKGVELCSPSIDICKVTIYLFKGEHYILRSIRPQYMYVDYDISHQNAQFTIQPLFCSENNTNPQYCVGDDEQVTIYNKLRDQFVSLVNGGLTLKNIIIDSMDSIILTDNDSKNCLGQRIRCCDISPLTQEIIDYGNYGCLNTFKASEYCHIPDGFSFFRFNIHQNTILTKPATLKIQNCQFKNILFDYNTFIELNNYGAYVEIENTKFEKFSTCGAIIRNFKKTYTTSNLAPNAPITKVYLNRMNELQATVQSLISAGSALSTNPFTSYCTQNATMASTQSKPFCYSISIKNSSFIQMNYGASTASSAVGVSSNYNMVNQGKILHLIQFNGPVTIQDSYFYNNTVAYPDCATLAMSLQQDYRYDVNRDDFDLLGTKDKIQLKHIISIQQHSFGVNIMGNIFKGNSVVKGVINIQAQEEIQSLYPLFIYGNQFIQNAAYFSTSAIHIRLYSTKQYPTNYGSVINWCANVHIEQNTFTNNFGCLMVGGSLLKIECFNPNVMNAVSPYDVVTITNRYTEPQKGNLYATNYAVNFLTPKNFTISYQNSSTGLTVYKTVDMYRIQLKNNQFVNNFAGNSEGLLSFYGLPRIYFDGDYFYRNGENAGDIIPLFNKVDGSTKELLTVGNTGQGGTAEFFYSYIQSRDDLSADQGFNFKMKSLIYFQACTFLNLQNTYVEGNFDLQIKYLENTAQFMYFTEFYGAIQIDNNTFLNSFGLSDPYLTKTLKLYTTEKMSEYKSRGNISPLIALDSQNTILGSFKVVGWTVKNMNFFQDQTLNSDLAFIVRYNYYLMNGNNVPQKPAVLEFKIVDLEMDNVNCINCDTTMNMFYFYAEKVGLNLVTITNINQLEIKSGAPGGSLYQSYSRIFKLFVSDSFFPQGYVMSFFSNSKFENITGDTGAIAYIGSYLGQTSITFLMENSTFTNIQSNTYGGVIFVQNLPQSRIQFSTSNFTNVRALLKGGIIYGQDRIQGAMSAFVFDSCIINDTYNSSIGMGIYIEQKDPIQLVVKNTNISCNSSFNETSFNKYQITADLDNYQDLIQEQYGSVFFIKSDSSSTSVISDKNYFKYCVNNYKGSIFQLSAKNVSFTDIQTTYHFNQALYGGTVACSNCYLFNFDQPNYVKNHAYKGGSLYFEYPTKFDDNTFPLTLNMSYFAIDQSDSLSDGGFLYFSQNGQGQKIKLKLLIEKTVFKEISSSLMLKEIDNIAGMTVGGGLANLQAEEIELLIIDSQFKSISSKYQSAGVILAQSTSANVTIKNISFSEVHAAVSGSLIYLQSDYFTMDIQNSQVYCLPNGTIISKDTSTIGSAFDLSANRNQSYVNSKNNKYFNCAQASQGGVFKLNKNINFFENISSYENNGALQGGAIYCSGCSLQIYSSNFTSMYASNGAIIYASDDSDILFSSSKVLDSIADQDGAFLYYSGVIKEKTVSIYNSQFINNTNNDGSGFSMSHSYVSFRPSFVLVQYQNYFDITTILMQNNQYDFEGIMYFRNAIITCLNNTYKNNYVSSKGGVFNLQTSIFIDTNSSYIQNAALFGGTMYAISSTINFENVILDTSRAQLGGFFMLQDNVQGTMNKLSVTNGASILAGFMYIQVTDNANYENLTFTVKNSKLQNLVGFSLGGAFTFNSFIIQVVLDSLEIYNVQSIQGGFIANQQSYSITINNIKVKKVTSSSSGQIFFSASVKTVSIVVSNSIFQCEETYNYDEHLENALADEDKAPNFYILTAQFYASRNNSYFNCRQGSMYLVAQSIFEETDSRYYNNSAINGAAILLIQSAATITGTKIYNNIAFECAAISLDLMSTAVITNSQFYNNYALNKVGVLRVLTQSYVTITNSTFENNVAENEISTINIFGSSIDNPIILTNVIFKNNRAYQSTIQVMYGVGVQFIKCQFLDNTNSAGTRGIFIGFSGVQILQSVFEDNGIGNQLSNIEDNKNTQGSFLYVLVGVDLEISQTQFINGYSYLGGAIFISGQSNVTISKTVFEGNMGYQGGAIVAQQFNYILIDNKSQFKQNLALQAGDDIFSTQSNINLTINNVIVFNSQPSNSIYLSLTKFYADNIQITHSLSYNQSISDGGAIYCQSCPDLIIKNSIFKNTNAKQGGAISLLMFTTDKDSSNTYKIENTIFENNGAYQKNGGALYISNVESLIIKDCQFLNGFAHLNGGSIYHDCTDDDNSCELTFQGTNKFENNFANHSGGAMFWTQTEPLFNENKTIFSNNSASVYANKIGCFSQKLGSLTSAEYESIINPQPSTSSRIRRALETSTSIDVKTAQNESSFRSGNTLSTMYIALIDKYNQIVTTDSSSKLSVRVQAKTQNNDKQIAYSSNYQPILEGASQFYAENGIFKVSGIQFTGAPGLEYQIIFDTDGIDQKKPSNQEYLQSQNTTQAQFDYNIQLRECAVGEKFSEKGACDSCPVGSSYSLVKMSSPGTCMSCPTSIAICYGGSFIGPKPGYWRKNNITSNFIECLNQDACLGMIPPKFEATGSCEVGYTGILCSTCIQDYSRTGSFVCAKCPDATQNILRITGLCLLAIFLIIFLIRSTLKGAMVKKNVMSIFQKIIMNHLQLIVMTAAFNFNWPQMVSKFFDTSQPVAQASTQVLSVDCFLNTRLEGSELDEGQGVMSSILYLKLLMFALLPILLGVSSYTIWSIISCKGNDKAILRTKAVSSLVILLFLVHPSLVSFFFKAFDCIAIDGENRNKEDLQILCSSNQHQVFSLLIALPGLIVWGLGIPFFAFILMLRKNKSLDSIETRAQFGFLYRGYKKQFYYWEIIIMYRKIFLIFISVYIVGSGIITQALIIFMTLIAFLLITMKKKPFQTVVLNNLEIISLITCSITIFCGLFFILDVNTVEVNEDSTSTSSNTSGVYLSENSKLAFFFVIVLSNVIFFTYWTLELVKELHSTLILKFGKIYLVLFLCNNQQKFEKLKIQMIINEENEILRESFMASLRDVKNFYERGEIVLNKNVLERLQMHFSKEKVFEVLGKKNVQRQETKNGKFGDLDNTSTSNMISIVDENGYIKNYRGYRKSTTKEIRKSFPTAITNDHYKTIDDDQDETNMNINQFINAPKIKEFDLDNSTNREGDGYTDESGNNRNFTFKQNIPQIITSQAPNKRLRNLQSHDLVTLNYPGDNITPYSYMPAQKIDLFDELMAEQNPRKLSMNCTKAQRDFLIVNGENQRQNLSPDIGTKSFFNFDLVNSERYLRRETDDTNHYQIQGPYRQYLENNLSNSNLNFLHDQSTQNIFPFGDEDPQDFEDQQQINNFIEQREQENKSDMFELVKRKQKEGGGSFTKKSRPQQLKMIKMKQMEDQQSVTGTEENSSYKKMRKQSLNKYAKRFTTVSIEGGSGQVMKQATGLSRATVNQLANYESNEVPLSIDLQIQSQDESSSQVLLKNGGGENRGKKRHQNSDDDIELSEEERDYHKVFQQAAAMTKSPNKQHLQNKIFTSFGVPTSNNTNHNENPTINLNNQNTIDLDQQMQEDLLVEEIDQDLNLINEFIEHQH